MWKRFRWEKIGRDVMKWRPPKLKPPKEIIGLQRAVWKSLTGTWKALTRFQVKMPTFGPQGRRTIRFRGKKYLIIDNAETASELLNKPNFLEKLENQGYDQIIIADSGQAIDVDTGEFTTPDLDLVPTTTTTTTAGGEGEGTVLTKTTGGRWASTTDPLRQLLGDDLYFAFRDLRGQKYLKPGEWESNWAQAREKWKHGDIADFAWMKLHELGEVPPEVSSALISYIQNPNDSTAKTLLDKLRPYADDTGDYRNLIEGYWAVGEKPPADLVETFKAEMAKISPHWNKQVPEYYARKWAEDRGLPWEAVKDWTYGDWLMYDSFARIYGLQRGGAYGEPVITSKLGYSVDEVLNMFENWYNPGGEGEVYQPTTIPPELPSTIESAHPPTPPRGTVYRPGELSGGVAGRQQTMGVRPVSTGYRTEREREILTSPPPKMPSKGPSARLGRSSSRRTTTTTSRRTTSGTRPSTPTPTTVTGKPVMPRRSPSARLGRTSSSRRSRRSSSRSSSRTSGTVVIRPSGGSSRSSRSIRSSRVGRPKR